MADDESNEDRSFAELMSGVKKLSNDRVKPYRDRIKNTTQPRQKTQDQRPDLDFSRLNYQHRSDIKDSHFGPGMQKKLQRKIRQGQLPVEDRIDLHGYIQKQAIAALDEFLHRAILAQFRLLVIIHGKGERSGNEAVLKPLVRHWLAQQSSVLAWCPAQAKHGGDGASYVYLRSLK